MAAYLPNANPPLLSVSHTGVPRMVEVRLPRVQCLVGESTAPTHLSASSLRVRWDRTGFSYY